MLAAAPLLADAPPGSVRLPLQEYRKLREAADERARHPRPEPTSPALESARLSVTPGDESAELTTRLQIDVPAYGSWKLPIPSPGKLASWTSAPPGAAIVSENGGRFLVAGRPGKYSVAMVEALSFQALDGYSRCELAAPAASAVALTVRLTSAEEDVRISEGALERQPGNVFTGTIPRGRTVSLDFRAREREAEAARFTSQRIDLVTLAGGRAVREGVADLTILAGRLSTLTLVLPPSESVESVSGEGVGRFLRDGARPERVLVTFVPPAKGRVRLYWKAELTERGRFVPSSLEGEDGGESYLAAAAEPGREVEAKASPGLERADPRELPPLLRALLPERASLVFRVASSGTEHALLAETKTFPEAAGTEAVIENLAVTSVFTSNGARLDRFVAAVRTKGGTLAWPIPDGTTLWSVFVNGKSVKPSGDGEETRLPLRGSRGSAVVDIVIARPGFPAVRRGEAALALSPIPYPILAMSWNLYFPEGKRYRLRDGNLREVSVEALESSASAISVPAPAQKIAPTTASRAIAAGSGATGNIIGRVSDEQSGALPGVAVTLAGCGPAMQTTTDSSGDFYFLNLPPCRYTAKAQLPGFATLERTNIVVRAGSDTTLGIPLKIASVATTITVTAETPLIDTRKQTSGANFTLQELSGSSGGVAGGVPGGVSGEVKVSKKDREERDRQLRAANAAVIANQVQQGLKSLPIDIPNEGKLFTLEGRLFFGEAPSVRVEFKD
jgi:hypothetical protein